MKQRYLFIFIVVLYLIWNLFYLDKYPLIDLDDVWMSDPSWQFVKHTNFSNPICEGFYGLEKNDIYHGRLYYLSQSLFFWLFNLGPYQARIASLLYGILVIILTYLIGKRLFNRETALLSSALIAISGLFVICSHRARQDMMLAAFILGAVYLFLIAKEKNSGIYLFLSGLVAGLSIDVHMNGIILYLLLPAMFIFERKMFSGTKKIYAVIFGIALGFLWWAGTHILPDYKLFFYQWKGIVINDFPTPVRATLNPFILLKMELKRYILWYWNSTYHRNLIEIVLLLAGILPVFRRKFSEIRVAVIIVAVIFLMFMLFVAQKSQYYMLFLYPFLMLIFSYSMLNMKKNYGKVIVISLCVFYILQITYISIKYRNVNYWQYYDKVKKYIPEKNTVFGDAVLWFGFRERFYADFAYGCFVEVNSKNDIDSFVDNKKIDYIIFGEKYLKEYLNYDFKEPKYELEGIVEDKYFGSAGILRGAGNFRTLIYKVN